LKISLSELPWGRVFTQLTDIKVVTMVTGHENNDNTSLRLRRSVASAMSRLLTSTLVGLITVVLAAYLLMRLYEKGRTLEAALGLGLLAIAGFLIYRGVREERKG